jgi:DNA-binding NarL/FixJ family response regulator
LALSADWMRPVRRKPTIIPDLWPSQQPPGARSAWQRLREARRTHRSSGTTRPKDGVQAAQEIHEQVDVPLVYLTAHSDQLTVDRAKRTHYDGFILKPFRARELKSTIEIAIQRHAIRTKQKEH